MLKKLVLWLTLSLASAIMAQNSEPVCFDTTGWAAKRAARYAAIRAAVVPDTVKVSIPSNNRPSFDQRIQIGGDLNIFFILGGDTARKTLAPKADSLGGKKGGAPNSPATGAPSDSLHGKKGGTPSNSTNKKKGFILFRPFKGLFGWIKKHPVETAVATGATVAAIVFWPNDGAQGPQGPAGNRPPVVP